MKRFSKFKQIVACLFLVPSAAIAGLWDDENDGVGTPTAGSSDLEQRIQDALNNSKTQCCVNTFQDGDGNINVGTQVSGAHPSAGFSNITNITLTIRDPDTPGGNIISDRLSVNNTATTSVSNATTVLFAPDTANTLQNRQRILGGLAQAFKNENGVSAIVVPTIVKGIVIEKTVALGIPAGLIVAENPFEGNTNTLTPTGAEFFNDIKLYGGDLAVAVGAQAKANAVAAQLVKNGANSEQVLVVPAAHMNNPNTVAVYVVRLPTMADLFVPVQTTN